MYQQLEFLNPRIFELRRNGYRNLFVERIMRRMNVWKGASSS